MTLRLRCRRWRKPTMWLTKIEKAACFQRVLWLRDTTLPRLWQRTVSSLQVALIVVFSVPFWSHLKVPSWHDTATNVANADVAQRLITLPEEQNVLTGEHPNIAQIPISHPEEQGVLLGERLWKLLPELSPSESRCFQIIT